MKKYLIVILSLCSAFASAQGLKIKADALSGFIPISNLDTVSVNGLAGRKALKKVQDFSGQINTGLNAETNSRINQITAANSLITSLQQAKVVSDQSIVTLQNTIGTQQTQLTQQNTQISTLQGQIGTQNTQIASQATQITNQNTQIATQKIAIDTLTNYINKLGVDPASIYNNTVFRQFEDARITALSQNISGGTYFAPTAISFGTITQTSIPIILTSVPNATSYTLKRDGTTVATLTPDNLTFVDNGLTPATAYTYSATVTDGTKISMPLTASATTLTNVTNTYVQNNYVDYQQNEQFNGGGYYGNFQIYVQNDDASQLSKSGNVLSILSRSGVNVDFQDNSPELSDGTYRLTITGLNLSPILVINTDGTYHDFTATSFNGGIAIYDFVVGGSSNRRRMEIYSNSGIINLSTIKIEKRN